MEKINGTGEGCNDRDHAEISSAAAFLRHGSDIAKSSKGQTFIYQVPKLSLPFLSPQFRLLLHKGADWLKKYTNNRSTLRTVQF
jgi:hypothetical protein